VDTDAARTAAVETLESERQMWQREKMQLQLRVDELGMLLQDARQDSERARAKEAEALQAQILKSAV
jgi:hypothetical protein